jgi:PhnB protein
MAAVSPQIFFFETCRIPSRWRVVRIEACASSGLSQLTKPTKGAATMSTPAVKAIPEGMHALTPHLVCAGAADAIEFYKKAFNAVELVRLPGPQGRLMHASLRIGDSTLMLVDEMPEHGALGPKALKGSPVTIHLYVENADATFEQAVAAGAKVTMPLADMFWGDRYGQLEDPFGHRWSVATHQRDVTPQEMQEAMRKMAQ